jgi:Uma2 family endonuclease
MASATLIPVSEYLATSYRPDCDYVDGEVLERNLGELEHALLQGILLYAFHSNRRAWDIVALPEQRVQVSSKRFRIPDVTILRKSAPREPIITHAPLICIEILSKDDTFRSMRQRASEYLQMGVEHVWILDPGTRIASIYTADGFLEPKTGELTVPGTPIKIVLAEIFAELQEGL